MIYGLLVSIEKRQHIYDSVATSVIRFAPAPAAREPFTGTAEKIASPLLERIDLHMEAEPVSLHKLMQIDVPAEPSSVIRERVVQARNIQSIRFKNLAHIHCNATTARCTD